jgi:NAD(P)-dependent dehydrogenase (short-subunit alcohol dehydrogenase family)
MDLRGKGALITGASRGLGAALAARSEEDLARVAARIRAAEGEAHPLVGDVGGKRKAHAIAGAAAALVVRSSS